MGIGQVSVEQVSLALGMSQAIELVRTLGLRTISLPKGSLHMEMTDNRIILNTIRNIRLNIVVLPNEILHMLHVGVTEELRAREQHTLNHIREYRGNNA